MSSQTCLSGLGTQQGPTPRRDATQFFPVPSDTFPLETVLTEKNKWAEDQRFSLSVPGSGETHGCHITDIWMPYFSDWGRHC